MAGHSHWARIKHQKAAVDAKKGKAASKLIKAVMVAVRQGGKDPAQNLALRYAIDRAKEANVAKQTIERAILKAAGELPGQSLESVSYEGYAAEGVALIVDILTDNRNRTVGELRYIFDRYGGRLGENGCVAWMFKTRGLVLVKQETIDEDSLLELLLEAGVEDLQSGDGTYEITCEPKELEELRRILEKRGVKIEAAEVTKIPDNHVEVDPGPAAKIISFLTELEDQDDVQNVSANLKVRD